MDIQKSAVDTLKGAFSILLQDLEALPDDSFDKSFGPATRTIADIVYEVNLVNDHVGMVIRGEEPFAWPDGWIHAPEDFRTKEAVITGFKRSSEKTVATAESFSVDQLEETIQTEQGPTTRYKRCQFMALHVWYHSGQLNFIQTLLGDDGWHWK